MKIFKYIFFLLLIVIIGGSIYIATLDSDYQVEETKVINAPATLIYKEVNDYKTWEEWGPWKDEDPDMVMNYSEKTSGEGASYTWQSEKIGDGSMKTVKATPYTAIDQKVIFSNSFGDSENDMYWKFEPMEGKTKVTWGMKGEFSFMDKAFSLTDNSSMSDMVKPMLKSGLNNLEEMLVQKMKQYSINIDGITEYGGGFYMYVTTASRNNPEALGSKMGKMLPQVSNFMKQNGIESSGQPITVYNQINEGSKTVIISSGIPTPSKVAVPPTSDVLCGYIEKTKAVKATLTGNYSNLPEAWTQVNEYLKNSDFEKNPEIAPFEIYVTDPGNEPNPANWETEIYIPVIQQEKLIDSLESL